MAQNTPAAPFNYDDFVWPPTNPRRKNFKKISYRDYGVRLETKKNENHALFQHKLAVNGEKSLPRDKPTKAFLLLSNPETGLRHVNSPKNRQEVLAIATRQDWYPILNTLGKRFAQQMNLCRNSCRRIYVDFHNVSRILSYDEKEPSAA